MAVTLYSGIFRAEIFTPSLFSDDVVVVVLLLLLSFLLLLLLMLKNLVGGGGVSVAIAVVVVVCNEGGWLAVAHTPRSPAAGLLKAAVAVDWMVAEGHGSRGRDGRLPACHHKVFSIFPHKY